MSSSAENVEPGDLNLYLPATAVIGTPGRGNPDKWHK